MTLMMTDLRALIVADHPLFREQLAHTLGAERGIVVVVQAADPVETIKPSGKPSGLRLTPLRSR